MQFVESGLYSFHLITELMRHISWTLPCTIRLGIVFPVHEVPLPRVKVNDILYIVYRIDQTMDMRHRCCFRRFCDCRLKRLRQARVMACTSVQRFRGQNCVLGTNFNRNRHCRGRYFPGFFCVIFRSVNGTKTAILHLVYRHSNAWMALAFALMVASRGSMSPCPSFAVSTFSRSI